MNGRVLMTILVLTFGVAAGYFLSPRGSSEDVARGEKGASLASESKSFDNDNDPPEYSKNAKQDAERPVEVVSKLAAPSQREFKDLAACTKEVERLSKTVELLVQKNSAKQSEMEFSQGKAIPFPPNLDPKYLEPALMKNVNKAYKEAGMDGDVSFVDCDEFPCIVCGELGLEQGSEMNMSKMQEMFKKLSTSEAMSEYDDAQVHNSVFASQEDSDGGSSQSLNNCAAIYPKQDDEQMIEDIKKRLHWRMMNISKTM